MKSDGPRTIVTRDVTFDESSTIKLDSLQTQHSLGKEKESVQVEISKFNLSNTLEPPESTYEFQGSDHDQAQESSHHEENEVDSDIDYLGDQPNLDRYSVARDRQPRV